MKRFYKYQRVMTLFMLKHTCACAHIRFRVHTSREHTHKVLLWERGFQFTVFGTILIAAYISALSLTQGVCWIQEGGGLHIRRKAGALRFGVLGLLMHDLQDHLTGGGAALGG